MSTIKKKIGKYTLEFKSDYNKTDYKIILICNEEPQSMGKLSRILKIAPVNTWKHVIKLEKQGILKVERQGRGKKTIVRINHGNKLAEGVLYSAQMLWSVHKQANNNESSKEIEKVDED